MFPKAVRFWQELFKALDGFIEPSESLPSGLALMRQFLHFVERLRTQVGWSKDNWKFLDDLDLKGICVASPQTTFVNKLPFMLRHMLYYADDLMAVSVSKIISTLLPSAFYARKYYIFIFHPRAKQTFYDILLYLFCYGNIL